MAAVGSGVTVVYDFSKLNNLTLRINRRRQQLCKTITSIRQKSLKYTYCDHYHPQPIEALLSCA